MENFKNELAALLNKHGMDTWLNTPDYVLADFLTRQLGNLDRVLIGRDDTGQLEQRLGRIERLLIHNLKNESIIMADLTQLTADVQATTDVEQSAVKALRGIKAQLDAAGTDPVKLKALGDSLESNTADLAAAIADTTGGSGASPATEGAEADKPNA